MYKIIFKGNPISTQHAYKNHGHIRYMTAEAKAKKEQYQWEAKTQFKKKPFENNVCVELKYYFSDNRKRDIDNVEKLVFDGCNEIVWKDDNLIKELHIYLLKDKENPRIEMTLYKL